MSTTKVTTDLINTLDASKLTGTLPAISGASLTNLPSEITKSSSDPTVSTNPAGGVGTIWLNTTSGEMSGQIQAKVVVMCFLIHI